MASIRRLKKDVDYLMFSVVADSLNYALKDGSNDEVVAPIVEEAIANRNELRDRISAGRNVSKEEKKAYFRAIFKDLLISTDASFTKLSEAIKAK